MTAVPLLAGFRPRSKKTRPRRARLSLAPRRPFVGANDKKKREDRRDGRGRKKQKGRRERREEG